MISWNWCAEVNEGDTGLRRLRDEVGQRVRESAEAEGRVVRDHRIPRDPSMC